MNTDRCAMLHPLMIGHFDVDALLDRRGIVVLKPLDLDAVRRLLIECGGDFQDGRATLGGGDVEFKDGYMISPWVVIRHVEGADEFARRLRQETGCVLFDMGARRVVEL